MLFTPPSGEIGGVIGASIGGVIGGIIGLNVGAVMALVADPTAQGIALTMDCYRAGEMKTCMEDCGNCEYGPCAIRKGLCCSEFKGRNRNCGCFDCTRTVLYVVVPGMLSGMVDYAAFLGNMGSDIKQIVSAVYGNTYPEHYGIMCLITNLVHFFGIFPLAFCLHKFKIRSTRFLIGAGAVTGIRVFSQLLNVISHSWNPIHYVMFQMVNHIIFSMVMYRDFDDPLVLADSESDPGAAVEKVVRYLDQDKTHLMDIGLEEQDDETAASL
eukprot:NODE_4420_length_1066_cov_216.487805_g4220_i0.p1 GENE.NODE_4420_length_1066_cov_216.487805_g4220_i0~~NODE_4420_length_1066_cov_216.487805_g4220_i0.p1  ORF type:complete len:269 (+),score=33.55 NODE_4420_length_1066_cov_216.487805_g4220_i0:54-860(+)